MTKLFVLAYNFLNNEASVLIEKKPKPSGFEYHVLLLEEPGDEFFISHLIFDAYSPITSNHGESKNVIHAIHKALHEQVVDGHL